jgi:uncharacterized protein (TIGR02466 family)
MGISRKFDYQRGSAPQQGGVELLFATPLWHRMLPIATPDFLARVKAYVMALRAREKGLRRSNVGGWHSSDGLFDADDEPIASLGEALLAAVGEMSYFQIRETHPRCRIEVAFVNAWANVLRDGDCNKPHVHPGVDWSGVFYVDPGDRDPQPVDNGNIEFMDPRMGRPILGKHKIEPVAGHALIFPSWLCHYVNPFRGRGERISIAFNANARLATRQSVKVSVEPQR